MAKPPSSSDVLFEKVHISAIEPVLLGCEGYASLSKTSQVTVCICTFRRPAMLRRLLGGLESQRTKGAFDFVIVVTDNDPERSAYGIVKDFAAQSRISITYAVEPRQSIALARNKALEHSKGDFVAFIDDDEFPEPEWLLMMLRTCESYQASGVLGPVRPHFEMPPPHWIIKGGFCERPEYPTGRVMDWQESRTGNLLFRQNILDGVPEPFRLEFGNGGEDKDFFFRMTRQGHTFRWCNEAPVYETVPRNRWSRRYMLKRALLRGRNILKIRSGRPTLIAKSLVAVPMYSLVLPFTLLVGHHIFMKYSIRFCDHAGRLLALVGLNPVNER